MSVLDVFRKQPEQSASPTSEISLDDLFDELLRYGRPYVHCHDDKTFSCKLEIHVSMSSVKFEVTSGYKHTTVRSAVLKTLSEAKKAIASLGGNK